MSRQVKGSNRRYKTIKNIKREYLNLSNKKKDKANKIVHMLKQYDTIVIQDEQIASWQKTKGMGRTVQHSCMGLIKSKLMKLDNVIILDRYIPTTKWCPNCHRINELSLNDRTYKCECGYEQDRDIHAAQNMLNIKNLVVDNLTVDSCKRIVPMERREVKREEFGESERRSAKRSHLQ